jgi:hypothetical protein
MRIEPIGDCSVGQVGQFRTRLEIQVIDARVPLTRLPHETLYRKKMYWYHDFSVHFPFLGPQI